MAQIRLSAAQRATLVKLKATIDEAEREVTRGEKAGLDVAAARATVNEARRLRDALLAEYGGVS